MDKDDLIMAIVEYRAEIVSHEKLFYDLALRIGELQWHIEKAFVELNSKCYIEKTDERGWKGFPETTSFGEEVDIDKIHWYVFKRETEVETLKRKTEEALDSAQKLKQDSLSLKTSAELESYFDLIDELKNFIDIHTKEIDALYDYVSWLYEKEVFAPIILFTYRVWGSTRRSDRLTNITPGDDKTEDAVRRCLETVLGLHSRIDYTLGRVWSDIHSSIAESADYEYQGPIYVPKGKVIKRTIQMVLDELATYFEFFRQSLRNILLEIEKYNDRQALLFKESFWRNVIEKSLVTKVETQLWDFKKTLTMWHTKGEVREDSKVIFCEDIASFANTKGGVLIVGVTDTIPREIVGIEDLENKLKDAKEVLSKNMPCGLAIAHFQQVDLVDGNDGTNKTCLIIAVAQTKNVVTVRNQKDTFSFPIRLETGIARVDSDKIEKLKEGVSKENFAFISNLYSFVYDK